MTAASEAATARPPATRRRATSCFGRGARTVMARSPVKAAETRGASASSLPAEAWAMGT
ncbi:hypothetical protein ACFPRL_26575 [Pseudoclavibacter helvolus]